MALSKIHFSGQVQDMDLRLLRVFKAVVESGGFSAAEVELNVSRSAISASMADLEARLGLKLCHRGRSGFSLTASGQQVYDVTLQLLNSMDAFRNQINTIHSNLKGELNIGITDNLITIYHSKIVKSLQRFKRGSPQVIINIRIMPTNEIEKAVLNGLIHIGMAPKSRHCQGLEYLFLYTEKCHLYCGEEHPLFSLEKTHLNVQHVLEYDTIALSYSLPADIQKIYDRHPISATVSDREGVAFLLMSGCFIGYLPSHYAKKWVQSHTFKRVDVDEFSYSAQIMAISKSGSHIEPVLDTYLQGLKEVIAGDS